MRYEIILAPEAASDLKRLNARLRSEIRDALERHLRHEPTKTSRSRIKRLRGLSRPQYRLRVGEIRQHPLGDRVLLHHAAREAEAAHEPL